ncbi:hypothetical protein PF005_g21864 [Phytophthora fragariae]|uniref:KATNIP domain-containing protein n=1 Tax=Phytophthora fragariae TaxID=53985 RepID=A0A6A3IWB0_9STRA|nr:hypothetical protein PF003_g25123 [Phytophthora fragariae]KAE8927133.1 hypothetical protein PF009_g22695 [Phytophthora fragariae]KAE8985218.1 hypothetical protein PF011_g20474 [Phytophthora fragariae]KAE9082889.1 hypothetical protein PF007_g22127 [Phytophthora fragariae]KAE9108329.1 hypothetical protein PF006_g20905 [Phytophthora fragariae]
MAERKRWDKQPDFHPPGSSSPAEAKADPVLTRQLQYLKVLEERNRVKKRLAAASKRSDRLHEREEAFVTAFNVPSRASSASTAAAQTPSTSSLASRNSRSATSVLPTKMPSKLSKCRSAPSTTLNFDSSCGATGDENRVRRAKWSRPQAPMGVAVEHHDGVPLFRLTTREEAAKSEDEDEDEEEEENCYLDESFEEFEEDGDERESRREELVIDDIEEDVEVEPSGGVVDSPVDLSKTTKELVGIIQHLSRTKQRALVDVLQKFQASEQDQDDVKVLQSSIGDPAIWKEISSTLNASTAASADSTGAASGSSEVPTVAPLKNLLEEQLRWEDQYANEMKERLGREREEKQRMLKQAEERRAKMMKQLEDEEREIERLMEVKRQERLAKLRALQEEAASADTILDDVGFASTSNELKDSNPNSEDKEALLATKMEVKSTGKRRKETREAFPEDEGALYAADAKSRLSIEEKLGVGFPNELLDAKSQPDPIVIVPKLNLAFNSSAIAATSSSRYEIHVKLLSTWSKTRAVGLTQICVYDLNGQELAVDLESVQLFDQPTGKTLPRTNDMVRGLHKLFNGVAQTNAEKDMWLGRLGDSGVLLVRFEVSSAPSKLCVWNHNSKTHSACTRDIEVLVSGKCVWTGSLPETFGDPDDNTCTWIDLLGTARKTARTARVENGSMPATGRSDLKESAQWAQTIRPQQRPEAESEQKPSESTPMWLAGSSAASSTSDRSTTTSRSTANLDTWVADEKPSSVTCRRRQGKPVYRADIATDKMKDTTPSELYTDRAEMKPNSSRLADEKPRYQQDLVAPSLASLSSWDSLEKFSKTNRSRLPQPTDAADVTSFGVDSDIEALEAKPKPLSTRTSFTTSALLTELRQGSMATNVSAGPSSYPDILKSSSSQQSFVDTPQFITSDVDKPNTAMIGDIPVLPNGRWLQIEILSTWGDPYYVGLNGVEIFDHHGELVTFHDPVRQVTACPESINVLEENSDDQRVPKTLVDGVNFTCDDFHMWLAPFTPGQDHYVLLELNASVSISMLRIWNYNKSRTHTCRGVREARLILYDSAPVKLMSGRESKLADGAESGKIIFEGEIRQAPGLVGAESMEISNEVILFTQEAAILEAIEANDEALRALASEQQREDEETREIVASVHRSMELQRPLTSDAGSRTVEQNQESDRDDGRQLRVGNDGRPMTMATRSLANRDTTLRTSIDSWVVEETQQRSPDALKMNESVGGGSSGSEMNSDENLPRGRRLTLQLHSTWGDKNYVGLTQVVVLVGSRGTPIPLDASNVDAAPRDLASLGYVGDPRTIDKLVDGEATTCDDTHMWLVPLEAGAVPEVRIELKTAQYFYGLRVWNYNKSPEDTYRGAKQLVVALDGVVISPKETGFLLRKAPGVSDFDFGQLVRFSDDDRGTNDKFPTYSERVRYPFATRAYKTPIIRQDYEAPLYPQGFLLKIICWTTWGDPYYLGLNGLELYDFAGARIIDKPSITTAAPYSVSDLDNSSGKQQDTRTPDNLLSGLDKNTWEAHDAWLAPFAGSLGNQQGNIVYIGFDTPVVLSMIKFWNYSKTPERGVKDVDIYLDDMHLFSGTLRKAPVADVHGASSRFGKVHKVTEQFGQAVLFSASQAQVDAEKRSVFYCGVEEQDVLGINEGQVMQESRAMYRKPDPGAEGVVVDLDLRPMTAVCRQ